MAGKAPTLLSAAAGDEEEGGGGVAGAEGHQHEFPEDTHEVEWHEEAEVVGLVVADDFLFDREAVFLKQPAECRGVAAVVPGVEAVSAFRFRVEAMDEALFEPVGQEAACDREGRVAAGKEIDEPAAGFEDAAGFSMNRPVSGRCSSTCLDVTMATSPSAKGRCDAMSATRHSSASMLRRRSSSVTSTAMMRRPAGLYSAYGHRRPPPASTMMEPAGRSCIFSPTVRS